VNITAPVSHVRSASTGLPAVGRSVVVTVSASPREGFVILHGKEIALEIQTPAGLRMGESYLLRRVAYPGGTLLEFTAPPTAPGPSVPVAPPSPDNLTQNILYSLFASQREYHRETVARMLSFFESPRPYRGRKSSLVSLREVRRALELSDRQIPPELTFLSSLIGGIPFSSSRQGRDDQAPGKKDSVPISLSRYLRRTIPRGAHELQLYNHIRPRQTTHWITIPLGAQRYDGKGAYLSGVFRIGLNMRTNAPERAVLTITLENSTRWWFNWKLPGPNLESWYSEGSEEIPGQLIAILQGGSGRGDGSTDTFRDGFPDVEIGSREGSTYE